MLPPFDAITIDGERLQGKAILRHARELHKRTGQVWTKGIVDLTKELVGSDGPLTARTSGTTGAPKTIAIPRADLIASAQLTGRTFGLHAHDRVLLCLPCEFIAGKMMVVRAMVLGLDLHMIDPAGSILAKLNPSDRFRFAAMVPQQLHRALEEDRSRVERQFDTILLGGGPVGDQLASAVQGLRTKVFHGYGSTETLTHVAIRALNGAERKDQYVAIGEVSFSTDPRGCLSISTPHLSTSKHITNDVVDLIDHAHFRWLGRIDHVILSGGRKIFPEQLEAKTAAVLPYPHYFTAAQDAVLGQSVALVIESSAKPAIVIAEATEALHKVLHKHEMPRTVHVVPNFKRTGSGKLVRLRLLPT